VPGLGRLFVVRDVTRETEVDRMKTEFISTVSHELRTPLTSIRGYVELLLDGDVGEISADQREFLELVAKSTVRLANLINDLLDVEKIESGRISMRREPVGLTEVLDQVVRTFQVTAAERGLGLHLAVEGPLAPVAGDADRLNQVFTNLISNAIKYTKQGDVRVSARCAGGEVQIAVADSGIGIAREHMPNLFGRFYRVDNQYTREVGGTGLGLAITKAIVERHGGRVEVDSAPGAGSTFTVRLPALAPEEGATPQQVSAPTPEGDGDQRRLVLIVEDEPDVARLIASHMARYNLRTAIASTGPEGLRLAKVCRPDLITLDVMLPHMDGWEVLTHLKHDPATAAIPVLVLSILEEADQALQLGADAYLSKPIDSQKLSQAIEHIPHLTN
jgi:CheY-like chemotaxis protein/anti-sigma regulatory factor (Ser/Thr protein kinase)